MGRRKVHGIERVHKTDESGAIVVDSEHKSEVFEACRWTHVVTYSVRSFEVEFGVL